MRTPLFLFAGFLLLASACIVGKLLSEPYPQAMTWATALFILIWLALAAANLTGGVTRAGYTVGEELPVFLLIFGLPALCMAVLRWKFL
jgi:hypothetical protein